MKHIEYIDSIKGFAIFLMVMGHAIAWNYVDWNEVCVYDIEQPLNVKIGGLIWQLIYSFHMPLFFMVSGYLSYKTYEWENFYSFLKKKIMRLLIPWIFSFGIIYLVRGSMGYWFLLCLFEMSVIGFIVNMFSKIINRASNCMLDVLIVFTLYFFIKFVHVYKWEMFGIELGNFDNAFLPYFIGVILRKYKGVFSLYTQNNVFYTCFLLLFVFLFVSRYFIKDNIIIQMIYTYSYHILPLIGSLLVFYAFEHGFFKKVWPILSYMGKKTLPIYILHILFVIQINEIGDFILNQNVVTLLSRKSG